MVELLRDAVKAVRGRLSGAEAGVIAVALVSLIETSLASILNQDAVYRGLGAKKSIAAVPADRPIASPASPVGVLTEPAVRSSSSVSRRTSALPTLPPRSMPRKRVDGVVDAVGHGLERCRPRRIAASRRRCRSNSGRMSS